MTPRKLKIGIYINSVGNYFFEEFRDLLIHGLSKCHEPVARSDIEGFCEDLDMHIIIGPHEFFEIGDGPRLAKEGLPDNCIMVTTEQLGSPWYKISKRFIEEARAVWDINLPMSVINKRINANT